MAYINKKKIYFAGISKGISERYTEGVIVEDIETEGATSLISFTIDGTTYQAEEGMTWGDFINSNYNPTTIPRFAVIYANSVGYSWDIYNTWPVKNPNLNVDVATTDIIESIVYDYYNPTGGGGSN